jgi:tetratricopeptide (TPR) repeat protein
MVRSLCIGLCLLAGCGAEFALGAAAEKSTAELEAELDERLTERCRRTVALGVFFEATGDWPRAVAYYEAARRIRDDNADTLTRLLRFYRTQGDVRNQISVYQSLIRLQPASVGWLRDLGACHLRLGEREQAEAAWRKILDAHPVRTQAIRYLAQVYEEHRLFDRCVELYREAMALAPEDPDFRVRLAETQVKAGDPVGALATVAPVNLAEQSAYATRSAAVRKAALPQLNLNRAERLAVEGILDEQKPQSAGELAWRLARWFEEAGDWDRAAAFFLRVAQEEPNTVRGQVAAETARRLKPKP